MSENDNAAGAESETISLSEYKKLQRTLARRDKSAKKSEEASESLLSTVTRLETLIEGLVTVVGSDEDLKPAVDRLLSDNGTRRKDDNASSELTARLSQTIDIADADWDDERFDSARKVYDAINETGDLARTSELEDLIRKAIGPNEDDLDERVRVAVEEQMSHVREGARVDTGATTAPAGRVSKRDLHYNPRDGIEGLRENLKKAMDQIAG